MEVATDTYLARKTALVGHVRFCGKYRLLGFSDFSRVT
jgi:hypothetical protein